MTVRSRSLFDFWRLAVRWSSLAVEERSREYFFSNLEAGEGSSPESEWRRSVPVAVLLVVTTSPVEVDIEKLYSCLKGAS